MKSDFYQRRWALAKHILIVDDSIDIQLLLKGLLESEGYLVSTANNGKEALSLLSTLTSLPQLILLDLMMPVMDGLTFIEVVKKKSLYSDINIILMSADNKLLNKRSDLNKYEFIKKPYEIEQLLENIKIGTS